MTKGETIEELANIVGEIRDRIRDKLESMEAEGVSCVPISDVRIILTEHLCKYPFKWVNLTCKSQHVFKS